MSTSEIKYQFSKNLFWDADIEEIDLEAYKEWIVGRVLDYGQLEDWQIITRYYGINQIGDIAVGLRTMFPKTLSFIALMTKINIEEFRCYKFSQSNYY